MQPDVDDDLDFQRAMKCLDMHCDTIDWLVRLWSTVAYLGSGEVPLERTNHYWAQGLQDVRSPKARKR